MNYGTKSAAILAIVALGLVSSLPAMAGKDEGTGLQSSGQRSGDEYRDRAEAVANAIESLATAEETDSKGSKGAKEPGGGEGQEKPKVPQWKDMQLRGKGLVVAGGTNLVVASILGFAASFMVASLHMSDPEPECPPNDDYCGEDSDWGFGKLIAIKGAAVVGAFAVSHLILGISLLIPGIRLRSNASGTGYDKSPAIPVVTIGISHGDKGGGISLAWRF